jgi:probable F420-dependent oxidoreductase
MREPRFDARLDVADLAGAAATDEERLGYAGTFTRETSTDPFLPLAAAATRTGRIELGTAVAIALARSPLLVAQAAHHLQALSGGRFVLGLGSQVRAHVERRYSMPFTPPVARMRDHLAALRAIWAAWRTGEPLGHRGPFHTHVLMTPAFRPPPHPHPDPPVLLAAVGPAMTALAAEAADGLLTHPIAGADYLRAVTLPAVGAALAGAGRSRDGFRVAGSALVATGRDEAELAAAVTGLRARIAFYASTPAYRPVLAHHGWGELADRLHALSRGRDPGRWDAMTALIPDEVVTTLGVVAPPDELGAAVLTRYTCLLDRVALSHPGPVAPAVLDQAVAAAQGRAKGAPGRT